VGSQSGSTEHLASAGEHPKTCRSQREHIVPELRATKAPSAQADEDLLVCSGLGEVRDPAILTRCLVRHPLGHSASGVAPPCLFQVEDVGTLPELRAWGGQQSEVAQPGVGEGNIENNVGAASKCPLHQGLFAAASSSASASSAFCRDPKVMRWGLITCAARVERNAEANERAL
jgi:hypothetical protein